MNKKTGISIFRIIMIGSILIIITYGLVLLSLDKLDKDEENICETYSNSKNISISYPELDYIFNGTKINEKELKSKCLNEKWEK